MTSQQLKSITRPSKQPVKAQVIEVRSVTVPNIKILEKLVFLFNHLIQYHVVDYKEVILRNRGSLTHNDVVIFQNKQPLSNYLSDLITLDKMIQQYLTTGYITKNHMKTANDIWEKLKDYVGLDKASDGM